MLVLVRPVMEFLLQLHEGVDVPPDKHRPGDLSRRVPERRGVAEHMDVFAKGALDDPFFVRRGFPMQDGPNERRFLDPGQGSLVRMVDMPLFDQLRFRVVEQFIRISAEPARGVSADNANRPARRIGHDDSLRDAFQQGLERAPAFLGFLGPGFGLSLRLAQLRFDRDKMRNVLGGGVNQPVGAV